jgi:hypothetical protein
VVRALDNAALICVRLQRPSEAEPFYNRALVTAKEVFGPDHPFSGQIMLGYSAVLRRLQRKTEAEALTREAHAVLRQGNQKRDTVDILELTLSAR